jgi:hypothetical protein
VVAAVQRNQGGTTVEELNNDLRVMQWRAYGLRSKKNTCPKGAHLCVATMSLPSPILNRSALEQLYLWPGGETLPLLAMQGKPQTGTRCQRDSKTALCWLALPTLATLLQRRPALPASSSAS